MLNNILPTSVYPHEGREYEFMAPARKRLALFREQIPERFINNPLKLRLKRLNDPYLRCTVYYLPGARNHAELLPRLVQATTCGNLDKDTHRQIGTLLAYANCDNQISKRMRLARSGGARQVKSHEKPSSTCRRKTVGRLRCSRCACPRRPGRASRSMIFCAPRETRAKSATKRYSTNHQQRDIAMNYLNDDLVELIETLVVLYATFGCIVSYG